MAINLDRALSPNGFGSSSASSGGGWGSLASASWDWVKTGASFVGGGAGSAFDWIEDNPTSVELFAGVAQGAAQGYMTQQQIESQEEQARLDREHQTKMQDDRQQASIDANKITYAGTDGYGSYGGLLSKGMVTNGDVAGDDDDVAGDDDDVAGDDDDETESRRFNRKLPSY